MIRSLQFGASVFVLSGVAALANAQPVLDRVLDGVQRALDNPTQPIPVHDESLNPLAEPAEAPQGSDTAPGGNEPGYLGVIADDRQEGGRGVRLLEVVAGSPAAQGGLRKDDLITSIGDMPIRSMDEMAGLLSKCPAGAQLTFVVFRGDAAKSVSVTLGQRPDVANRRLPTFGRQPETAADGGTLPPPHERPKLGVRTLPISDEARQQFNLPDRNGAMVVAVTPGSAADRAGLKLGAVITQLNGQTVRSPEHLAELVAATPGDFDLTYIADGRVAHTKATFGNAAASRVVGRPAMPDTAMPEATPVTVPDDQDSRLEAIERRLQDLEDRIQKLEEARAPNP